MTKSTREHGFGALMLWTIVTGIFAWLPLVRIVGRPEGYTWGILGLSGAGTDGPFWIFIVLTTWVLAMLFTTFRGPRAVAYPLLLLWHLALTGVVVASVVEGGTLATWQGQGLHFAVPMWILLVPFAGFAVLTAIWVVWIGAPAAPPWRGDGPARTGYAWRRLSWCWPSRCSCSARGTTTTGSPPRRS